MFRVRLLLVAFFLHPTLFVFGSSAVRVVRWDVQRYENMMENWSFRVNKTKSNMWQEGESRTHTQSTEERLPSVQTERRDLMKTPTQCTFSTVWSNYIRVAGAWVNLRLRWAAVVYIFFMFPCLSLGDVSKSSSPSLYRRNVCASLT